jgi:hypothetical protein
MGARGKAEFGGSRRTKGREPMSDDERSIEEIREEIAELRNRMGRRADGISHSAPTTYSGFVDMVVNDQTGGRFKSSDEAKQTIVGRRPTPSYPASALSNQPDAGIEPPFDIDIGYVPIVNEPFEVERARQIAES